jgi:type IV secretion system protein VirB11
MEHVTSEQLLSPLKPWLNDPLVSEIMMNKPGEIYVEKEGRISRYGVIGLNVLHVTRFLQMIANENEKVFDTHAPLLSGRLYDQSRIQAVLPPISRSVCFSIRKHSEQSRTWESLMTPAYFRLGQGRTSDKVDSLQLLLEKSDWPSFLRAAQLAKKTVLISGETGSGKTTLLSVLLSAIRKEERVIVLEDTQELPASRHNSLSLLARDDDFLMKPIDLAQLLRASLRLRPDRLVLGELRSHEAYDFISACQTGHGGSMATIHAGSPHMALERLTQLYLLRSGAAFPLSLLRELISNVIDVVVQLSRRSGGPSVVAIYYRGKVYE